MLRPDRLHRALRWLAFFLLVAAAGCTRAHYRRQADCEAYATIAPYDIDPRWHLEDYSIQTNKASRMFDPYNPDRPPLPPDDPTSHRLMHCVDCKKGWPYWHADGDTCNVENPYWQMYLPRNEKGELVLTSDGAVSLGFLNSREYQQELEDLYLSALDVTFQRFRFDTQFFANSSAFFTAEGPLYDSNGGKASSTLAVNQNNAVNTPLVQGSPNNLQARRLLATGGTLIVGLANQFVWQFSGPNQYTASTLLDFSLVQPLLAGGGRAIALEGLTDAERTLLANVRQMEHYRRAFWVALIDGRGTPGGPVRGGLAFSSLAPVLSSSAQTGIGGTVGGAGLLGLLGEEQSIENQRANATALRGAVEQLEITFSVGRIDRYQVDFARQTLLNTRSSLLALIKQHQDRLDAYKIQLGLPPSVVVKLADPLLKRFNVIDPSQTDLSEAVIHLLDEVRDLQLPDDAEHLARSRTRQLGLMREEAARWFSNVQRDIVALDEAVPRRTENLRAMSEREEVRAGDMDRSLVDVAGFEQRVAAVHGDYEVATPRMNAALKAIEAFEKQPPPEPGPGYRNALRKRRDDLEKVALGLSFQLSDLSLVQARARLDTLTLVPIELSTSEALEIARANRLDWMNARAALVDVWRQIEISANALQAGLNVRLNGNLGTVGNDPLRFRSTTGAMQAGVEFNAPLTRLAERNLYRESLIDYERARRAYYAFEDRVSQSLRSTIYAIRLDQLNFELRRAAVSLSLTQTEQTRFRLTRPPKPGEATVLGATTSRDLVDSLSALLNAQNGLLSVWVDFETQRMNLDLDLGTFRLDQRCRWIDPGPIRPGDLPAAGPEVIPPPGPAAPQVTQLRVVSEGSQ